MNPQHMGRFVPVVLVFIMACDHPASYPMPASLAEPVSSRRDRDMHSYGNPDEVVVRHLDLDWDVNFNQRTLSGTAVLLIDRVADSVRTLRLDTRELLISRVEVADRTGAW